MRGGTGLDVPDIEISFAYGGDETAVRREVVRNVRTILSTPVGTCPLYRDFGVDLSCLDRPLDAAQNLFALAAMEAVERWEPRAGVDSVAFETDLDGRLRAKVVIRDG